MTRWARGESEIERMIAGQELQRIRRGAADGAGWSEKASVTLASAERLADADPSSALALAYDAARFACLGVLARQALRPTTKGGHYAIQQAMRWQFGDAFDGFGTLRRRRNELEYPEFRTRSSIARRSTRRWPRPAPSSTRPRRSPVISGSSDSHAPDA